MADQNTTPMPPIFAIKNVLTPPHGGIGGWIGKMLTLLVFKRDILCCIGRSRAVDIKDVK